MAKGESHFWIVNIGNFICSSCWIL